MKRTYLLSATIMLGCSTLHAQDDQIDLLKSIFSEAGNSYTWKLEQTAPTSSTDLKFTDNNITIEFVPMDEKQLSGPYQLAFWVTNNTSSNIEINWEKSYLTSLNGTQRKVYHGEIKTVSSAPQRNSVITSKSKIGDAVIPTESITTMHHNGEYNEYGEWVEPWNEITGYQLFYGDDFPGEFDYESIKANCEGKSFKLHLAMVVSGAAKNYDFAFKVASIEMSTSEENPLLDVLNENPSKTIEVGSRVKGNWHNEGLFYPGTVTQIQGDQYYVEYDDGDTEWTTLDKLMKF